MRGIPSMAASWTTSGDSQLLVGPDIVSSLDPQLNDFRTGAELMHTYAEIATTQPFLETVSQDLSAEGADISARAIGRSLSLKSSDATRILTIYVQDLGPNRVVVIANAVARALVRSSPSSIIESDALLREQMRTISGRTIDGTCTPSSG